MQCDRDNDDVRLGLLAYALFLSEMFMFATAIHTQVIQEIPNRNAVLDDNVKSKEKRQNFKICKPIFFNRFNFFTILLSFLYFHTRLTMNYVRSFQYDCTSMWLYVHVLVLVALRSVLVTSREYTCIFTFYTLP